MVTLNEFEADNQPFNRDRARQGHTLGWLVLACALITLIVCVFSWVATFGLLPERALASGESMLAADYSPWEGYRILNLDVANLATAGALGDAPWQGAGTPMIVATIPPVTPIEITSQATPLPTQLPVEGATATRRPVLPRATGTLPPTIPAVTSTATVLPTTAPPPPPPAPTSPPPAPTSPPPVATATPVTPTATSTPDTPTATATSTPDTPTATATNPPGDTTNPPNGTITARGDNNGAGEGMDEAFDNSSATKWLDFSPDPNRASWIQYMYPGSQTNTVTQYTITSANDNPARDPYNWRLFGIDALGNAFLLDTQTAQIFSGRFVTNTYTIANTTAYRGYMLQIDRVFDPATANSVQLAEIELIGY